MEAKLFTMGFGTAWKEGFDAPESARVQTSESTCDKEQENLDIKFRSSLTLISERKKKCRKLYLVCSGPLLLPEEEAFRRPEGA